MVHKFWYYFWSFWFSLLDAITLKIPSNSIPDHRNVLYKELNWEAVPIRKCSLIFRMYEIEKSCHSAFPGASWKRRLLGTTVSSAEPCEKHTQAKSDPSQTSYAKSYICLMPLKQKKQPLKKNIYIYLIEFIWDCSWKWITLTDEKKKKIQPVY